MNTIQTIQVKSDSTLGYVDVGEGLPIILIHGLFLDHTAFEEQIKAFASRYRMIAIDIHGHGESSVLNQSISLDEMAGSCGAAWHPTSNMGWRILGWHDEFTHCD